MVRGLAGDARAHAALLKALIPALTGFYRHHHHAAEAGMIDDLVQETLIAVHQRRATYDTDRPFAAWLFAIARYKLIDHLRRRRVHHDIEAVEDLLVTEAFENALTARLDVDKLLASLPGKQAAAIRGTQIEGLSIAEHAKAADIGQSDVKISVHRGLKALSARFRRNSK